MKGAGLCGRPVLALLLLSGDDGLEVLAFSAFLAPVAVRGLRDLLCLVNGSLFDVGTVHHGLLASPPQARYQWEGRRAWAMLRCDQAGGRVGIMGSWWRQRQQQRTSRRREARPARVAVVPLRCCALRLLEDGALALVWSAYPRSPTLAIGLRRGVCVCAQRRWSARTPSGTVCAGDWAADSRLGAGCW